MQNTYESLHEKCNSDHVHTVENAYAHSLIICHCSSTEYPMVHYENI